MDVVQVLGGWSKFRQVVFSGTELLCFPGVVKGLGVQFGVPEHLAKPGVVVWAVYGGVDVVRRGELVMGPG